MDLGNAFLTDMKIAGGGGEMGMTQEMLDCGNLRSTFDEMRGKGMAKTMDTTRAGEFGATQGAVEKSLAVAFGDGLAGNPSGEEITPWGFELAVILPKDAEQRFGEKSVARLTALGVGDPELVALRDEVLNLNVSGFGETQTAAVDGGKEGVGAKIMFASQRQKGFDFLGAENTGKAWLAFGADDPR